jgi:hypothetical protein
MDKIPGMMPVDIPHFCLELNFRSEQSVDVDNGYEKFGLPIVATENGCQFSLTKATLYGDMVFIVDTDSTIQLIDTAWTKLKTFSTFKKVTDPERKSWRFLHFLNDRLIAEEYALFKNGVLQSGVVSFLSNGQINRMRPYIGYSLCFAGDCLGETDPPASTINLIDENGKTDTFVIKWIEGKMSIELYSIGPPIPDEKGGRSIGPMVYELRTE